MAQSRGGAIHAPKGLASASRAAGRGLTFTRAGEVAGAWDTAESAEKVARERLGEAVDVEGRAVSGRCVVTAGRVCNSEREIAVG